ncbi:flavin monoamine oxidase family protein [Nitratireductor sp.]|uniref:flavin monoamine oxidase family protein n=2 Tax=unclassified Nitratireductor TaxID=2641084 RepID=UPI003459857F
MMSPGQKGKERKNMQRALGQVTRRDLLTMIGATAGSAALYQAMTTLGHARSSPYKGPVNLQGDPGAAKVLILGAGLAGMVAALELRAAGYEVEVLEYREKAGGRCWTLRGGDTYTELGGFRQDIEYAEGNYFNPGPWRIPHHHHAILDYCRRLGVRLEPFIQRNHNAYLHSTAAFGGKPQRFREIATDFRGHTSELLAKAVDQGNLGELVSDEDKEMLLEALRINGVLDRDFGYVKSQHTSEFRGFQSWPGGGANAAPRPSEPIASDDLLQSGLWRWLGEAETVNHQETMFQPVGGMDMIAQAFEREITDLVRYNTKVISIKQDETGVTAIYEDTASDAEPQETRAEWCICTIPFSILGQIENNFSDGMKGVIDKVHYAGSVKFGLEFNRRFWEEDEHIYGGISYTDLPISLIGYPSNDYLSGGKGVLVGGYSQDAGAYQFTAMAPKERIRKALEYGAIIHPQYRSEFSTGASVVWHRVPWALGCYGTWNNRKADYDRATRFDGRTLMAGEHISYLPGWQEGALLSGLDAISRLHDRVMNG